MKKAEKESCTFPQFSRIPALTPLFLRKYLLRPGVLFPWGQSLAALFYLPASFLLVLLAKIVFAPFDFETLEVLAYVLKGTWES